MTKPPLRIVVSDANVLINLMQVTRLCLFATLPNLQLVIPDHVREEITIPEQRADLDRAVAAGLLQVASIKETDGITLFAELTGRLGRGEAACLVLAVINGWMVASDEKRRFRSEAVRRIGKDRIIGTADLFIRAIRAGLITIEEADADKELLERRRFKLPFSSFRELLTSLAGTESEEFRTGMSPS